MRLVPFALAVSTVLALPAAAQSVIKVPADFETIQEAVDAAVDGDTILVSKGTYEEDVFVQGKTDLIIRGKGKVVIAPPAGTALTLDTCTGVRVEKIRTQGGSIGIRMLDSNECVLSKCRTEDTTGNGIRIDEGTGHLVEKCVVTGAQDDAIVLAGGSLEPVNDSRISKCTVQGPAGAGLILNGSDNVVEKCAILDGTEAGFVMDTTVLGTGNVFSDCRTQDIAGDSYVVNGEENELLRCKVLKSPAGIAFRVPSGANNALRQCKSVKSGGIWVEELADTTVVEKCKVTAAEQNGLRLDGLGPTVSLTRITGCNGHGILIASDLGVYTENKSTGNAEVGFRLSVGAASNTLGKNVAKGNTEWDLEDVSGEVNNIDDTNSFKNVAPP